MFTHLTPASRRAALTLRGIRFAEGEGEGGDGGEGGGEFKAITSQEELDKVLGGRLARERDKFKDYDALKEKAGKWDEYETGNKTPDQKAIDDARSAAEQETTQKFLRRVVSSETKSIATSLGFNDPADALAVIDPEKLPVKDDEPDTDAIKKLVEKLATDKPYLVKNERGNRRRPPLPDGDPADKKPAGEKGKAAAALRSLAAARRNS